MDDELTVIEVEGAFLVTLADDPEDWVASFQKSPRFPACDWAERMAALYNLRHTFGVDHLVIPVALPVSYHPSNDDEGT